MSPTTSILVGIIIGIVLTLTLFVFAYILVTRAVGVKQSVSGLVFGHEHKLNPPVVLDGMESKRRELVDS